MLPTGRVTKQKLKRDMIEPPPKSFPALAVPSCAYAANDRCLEDLLEGSATRRPAPAGETGPSNQPAAALHKRTHSQVAVRKKVIDHFSAIL